MAQTSTPSTPVDQAVSDFKAALNALPSSGRLSRADADAIYALAYSFISQGQYESAFRYFSLLTLFQPTNFVYLTGLALTHKLLERYAEAISVYSLLALIDSADPAHTLGVAECQLLQRDYEEATKNLELVIRFCREQGRSDRVLSRAEGLLALTQKGAVPAGH